METTFDYLRQFGPILAERILETYPPLQSIKDPVSPGLAGLLRKPLPAQAVAITGTAKYLREAKAARIVAECGAGKTFMSLGTIHVLSEGQPTTTLVMCPSHIKHKVAETLVSPRNGRTRFSALWQADRNRIQRMAPIDYVANAVMLCSGWRT